MDKFLSLVWIQGESNIQYLSWVAQSVQGLILISLAIMMILLHKQNKRLARLEQLALEIKEQRISK